MRSFTPPQPVPAARRITAVLLTALAVMLAIASPAHAQEGTPQPDDITVESLVIQVWPEFDEPSALVIMSGRVGEDDRPPVELTLPLPETAEINAVAYTDPDTGQPFVAQYTQVDNDIVFTSPNGLFLIEFYDMLTFDGDTRSYTLTWRAPYSIAELVWEVQQPINASDLEVDAPGETQNVVDAVGLPTTRVIAGSVEAGEELTLSFTYSKPDDTLSASAIAAAPTLAPDQSDVPPSAQDTGPSAFLIVVLLLGGLALIGGGAYWYVRQTRPAPRRSGQRAGGQRAGTARGSRRAAARSGERRFCTQCGEPVDKDDRFCRNCGAKL